MASQSRQLQFLDLSDDENMTATERKTLHHIMQPSSLPLPGTEGKIWRTPRTSSPEVEFGDGVSAVFKSLNANSKTENNRHVLSANTAPFVPSGIPIPLPTMGNGHTAPHSIHINNFTANLNYQGVPLPVAAMERNSPVATGPFLPGGLQYSPYLPVSSVYDSHYPHYPHPSMVLIHPQYQPLHPQPPQPQPQPQAQPQPQPQAQAVPANKEESQSYTGGGGITFGSTPVVSIRAGGQSQSEETSQSQSWDTENIDLQNSLKPNLSFTNHSPGPAVQFKSVIENRDTSLSSSPQSSTKTEPIKANQDETNHVTKVAEETPVEPEAVKVPEPAKVKVPAPAPAPPPVSAPAPTQAPESEPEPEPEPVSAPTSVAAPAPEPAAPSSWAGLFAPKTSSAPSEAAVKPTARIPPFSATENSDSSSGSGADSSDRELGQFLNCYALKHLSSALLPRGLLNRSNWCFVNAILQALLASPPFYNMMKSLSTVVLPFKKEKSKTPMMDSILEFISEFSVLDTHQINKPQKKDKNRKKEEIVTGISLEPIYVYNMLLNREDETFKVIEGRQEDAEEFLSFLLNGLSDEMLGKMKLVDPESAEETEAQADDGDEDADDWKEVGAKGKSCVTRRIADTSQTATPIQSLALGMCRSCVKSETGDNSATLQPFYTLQLNIQDEHVNTLADALSQNFANEKLDGYICSKTKKEIEATRILSLEELPPVLILHLKRFVYDGKTGGAQKIMKQIDFGVDLEISKSILSAECRASNKQRQYKLFSVVYHNGREATKGHYVTDIFHTGYSSWLHCDDSQVSPTCEQSVLAPGPTSTPYLLFYRRGDTMLGMERKTNA